MKNLLVCAAIILVCAGCFGGGGGRKGGNAKLDEVPDWVRNPPEMPGMMYAVGSAPGKNRDAATAKARRELGAQIRLSVKSQNSQMSAYSSSQGTNQSRRERLDEWVREHSVTEVDESNLPGVKTAKEELAKGDTYVLVEFDRSAWATQLRKELGDLDRDIEGFPKDYATGAERPLATAARIYQEMMPILIKRDEVAKRLRVADPTGDIPAIPYDVRGLLKFIETLVNKISIRLPDHPSMKNLVPSLAESMAKKGLSVMATGGSATLDLSLELTAQTSVVEGMQRVEGSVRGVLTEVAGKRVIGGIDLSTRQSASTADLARNRLEKALAAILVEDVDKKILEMVCRAGG